MDINGSIQRTSASNRPRSKMEGEEIRAVIISSQNQSYAFQSDKKFQYLYTLAANIIVFGGGTILGWSAPALPALQAEESVLNVTEEQGSWIGSLVAIGALVGALPAGTLADHIGRKLAIIVMAVPEISSWLLIFFARNVNTLYAARLLGGFGIGATSTIVPMYVSEIAESAVRGALGSAFQLMMVSGVLYTYILGAVVHYTILPILCVLVYIVFFAAFFTAPESPVYLLKKDQWLQAEYSLKKLRGPRYDVQRELQIMQKDLSEQSATKPSFCRALKKKACRLGLIICLGMMVFQQMSGINIVIFYTASIFQDAGSTLDPAISTIIVGLAQVVGAAVSTTLIDRAGRKILLQLSAGVMAICLAVLGYYFYAKGRGEDVTSIGMVPLVSLVIYILLFAVGLGPIPWMLAGEVMSPEIKAKGSSLAVALNWSLAFAVTKIFQPLNAEVGPAVTYWMLAAICVMAFLFVTFVVIETKGKSLTEVQEELSGNRKRTCSIF